MEIVHYKMGRLENNPGCDRAQGSGEFLAHWLKTLTHASDAVLGEKFFLCRQNSIVCGRVDDANSRLVAKTG